MIISSIVRQDPPALVILARAPSVKRRAATSSLGRSKSLMSSVTVPTITAVRPCLSYRCLTSLLRETGGLIVLEATSLLRMVLQKLESVLLERNLKSCAKKDAVSKMMNERSMGPVFTYSDKQVLIKILAFAVLLILLLNSASFIQVDTLHTRIQMVSHCRTNNAEADLSRYARPSHIPFFLLLIFVLNNKSTTPCGPMQTLLNFRQLCQSCSLRPVNFFWRHS